MRLASGGGAPAGAAAGPSPRLGSTTTVSLVGAWDVEPPTAPGPEALDSRDGGATASVSGNGGNGVSCLSKSDYGKFVHFFRTASPYISGHRGRTFVIVIPGEVVLLPGVLQSIMADIALLHGLGVRVVIVLGAAPQIDAAVAERGLEAEFHGSYRITGAAVLEAAVEAAGRSRTAVERYLSRAPSVPVFRRHAKDDGEMHFGPALQVVSGNYVAAKRRGVVDGVDFGFTGEVRFVVRDAIRRQLDNDNIVLLSNLGFTAGGEVLNCNTYDVGLHAAVELGAEKVFCLHLDDVAQLGLPQWLPISSAREMLLNRMTGHVALASMDADEADRQRSIALAEAERYISVSGAFSGGGSNGGSGSATPGGPYARGSAGGGGSRPKGGGGSKQKDFLMDLDLWHDQGFPVAVSVSVVACCRGVKRAHLVDARIDGGLLLELYSRDGIGTMISADFYEGIRAARMTDVDGIHALLAPLEKEGVVVKRSKEDLMEMVHNFTVLDREAKILGCALLLPLGATPDGARVAELGAFCIDASFRGTGRGDSMLDYVEQEARARGVTRLVLLTTRTADWFMQRDFQHCGPAAGSALLPESRRKRVNAARNSQLYVKEILPLAAEDGPVAAPGKRIGF
ncbi:MAG: N-acetylglutamate synthase [Monoraphidium minutum]|nr:MAG: N-acetylglutamate synthase [Monoraphidium minutum]